MDGAHHLVAGVAHPRALRRLAVPRLPEQPEDASNRRIVILVLKKEIEDALRGTSLVSRSHDQVMDELGSGAESAAERGEERGTEIGAAIGRASDAADPVTTDISINTETLGDAGEVISEFSDEDLVGL